jgi:hypothetical protein
VAVSPLATLFHVASSRAGKVIATLVGTAFAGVVTSDRLKSYRALAVDRRQVCWAHLIRNLLALAERNGRLVAWAADLLAHSELLFALWHTFRAGRIDRDTLAACMQPLQASMRAILERGQRRDDQAQGLSEELLSLWPALWTFVSVEGVEPTGYPLGERGRTSVATSRLVAQRLFRCPERGGQHIGRTYPDRRSDMSPTGTPSAYLLDQGCGRVLARSAGTNTGLNP